MWATGEQIVLREVWHGRLWSARPVRVVRDDADLVALHLPVGAAWMRACGADGRRLALPVGDWRLRDIGWPVDCLRLHVPGAHHDVLVFREPGGERVRHWYVNLQTPLQRTGLGFDYTDHVLDAVVSADRTTWRWEDEDELAEALARGLLSAERAAFLREEGLRAIERLRSSRPPYDQSWERWRPDPSWPVPSLPPGWDVP